MVLVSHDRAFVFLKTRKTAGTAIEMVLEPFCRAPGAEVVEKTPTLVSAHGIVGRRRHGRTKLQQLHLQRDWYNHMPAAEVRRALGRRRWESYLKITAIRNPFDVAVSRYHWDLARTGRPEAADFAETRARFRAMLQATPITCDPEIMHIDGQFVADEVIRHETLVASVAALFARLAPGQPVPPLPRAKDMSRRRLRPVAEYFDAETTDLVLTSAAWVFDRFGYPTRPPEDTRSSAAPQPVVSEMPL